MTTITDDQLAIIEVTHLYAHALDTNQYDLLDEVFTPDAVGRYGNNHPTFDGRDMIRDQLRGAQHGLDASQHMVANHRVSVDGDTATCACELRAGLYRKGTPGGDVYTVVGRYEDQLVRVPGGWRISVRTVVRYWTEGNHDVTALRRDQV